MQGQKEKKVGETGFIIKEDEYTKQRRKLWVRLIKKIYEVDILICPKCNGDRKIIAFIENYKVVRKILTYLKIFKHKRGKLPLKILSVAYI